MATKETATMTTKDTATMVIERDVDEKHDEKQRSEHQKEIAPHAFAEDARVWLTLAESKIPARVIARAWAIEMKTTTRAVRISLQTEANERDFKIEFDIQQMLTDPTSNTTKLVVTGPPNSITAIDQSYRIIPRGTTFTQTVDEAPTIGATADYDPTHTLFDGAELSRTIDGWKYLTTPNPIPTIIVAVTPVYTVVGQISEAERIDDTEKGERYNGIAEARITPRE